MQGVIIILFIKSPQELELEWEYYWNCTGKKIICDILPLTALKIRSRGCL